eukprot:COSAG01_NODE_29175_length_643_cov_1.343750_1_plen_178_part_10
MSVRGHTAGDAAGIEWGDEVMDQLTFSQQQGAEAVRAAPHHCLLPLPPPLCPAALALSLSRSLALSLSRSLALPPCTSVLRWSVSSPLALDVPVALPLVAPGAQHSLDHLVHRQRLRADDHLRAQRDPHARGLVVSRPFPSWNRSILTEIYRCHACSYHEIEDENGRAGTGRQLPAST